MKQMVHSKLQIQEVEHSTPIFLGVLSSLYHQLTELRRHRGAIQQGELSWRSAGSDGLVAQADGWEIWINRSRHEALALPAPQAGAEIFWSSDDTAQKGAIATQSAALLLTTPK